jgi:hypothetical protein
MICAELNCRHIVVDHTGHWNKPLALNYAIKRSDAYYIGTFDIDMIFSGGMVKEAIAFLEQQPNSLLVAQVYDLPPNTDYGNLDAYIKPEYYHAEVGVGGVQIAPAHMFHILQGYDEQMKLWGGMDVDMAERFGAIGYHLVWLNELGIVALHQYHDRKAKEIRFFHDRWRRNNDLIGCSVVKNIDGWGETGKNVIVRQHQVTYPEVSIVVGTFNRIKTLKPAIESARASAAGLPVDFVVVDGGSTDGTQEWCYNQRDITLIEQKKLLGAIKAFNAGFSEAKARYVAHINDDCIVLDNCIFDAWGYLNSHDDVGQIAFYFSDDGETWKTGAVWEGQYPYANFGMTRKWLGDHVGWWGQDYYKYAGDSELSLRIWLLGYKVKPLDTCKIRHFRTMDELRRAFPINIEQNKFFKKWGMEAPMQSMPSVPLVKEKNV